VPSGGSPGRAAVERSKAPLPVLDRLHVDQWCDTEQNQHGDGEHRTGIPAPESASAHFKPDCGGFHSTMWITKNSMSVMFQITHFGELA
jgi:hypothetical protein